MADFPNVISDVLMNCVNFFSVRQNSSEIPVFLNPGWRFDSTVRNRAFRRIILLICVFACSSSEGTLDEPNNLLILQFSEFWRTFF